MFILWFIQHIGSYPALLLHSAQNDKWTSVDCTFVAWLPTFMREHAEVRPEYKWPRFLLGPIEGVDVDDKNQGFMPWSNVDRVSIQITN